MKKSAIVVSVTAALLAAELGAVAWYTLRTPAARGGAAFAVEAPAAIDVELLPTPPPILLNGCFKPLIRGPGKVVAPCAQAPAPVADPVAAPAPSYAVLPPVALPMPAAPYVPPVYVAQPPAPVAMPAPTPYVPRELAHTGGGFFDRAPPCYRTERSGCPD
jgi:hypothetical protein